MRVMRIVFQRSAVTFPHALVHQSLSTNSQTKSIMINPYFFRITIAAAISLALSLSLAMPASGQAVTDTAGPTDSPNSTAGKQQTKLSSNKGATAVADVNATDSKASTKSPAHAAKNASKKIVKRGKKPSGYGEPGNISTIPDGKTAR